MQPINKDALQKKVAAIVQLQALPANVVKVMQTLNNKNATAEDVGREISEDPALSAKVLKLVNSGFYGFKSPVASISQGTVLLGFTVMRTVILSTTIIGNLPPSMDGLWKHCLACARSCVLLGRALGLPDPDELGVIGLLHDIGKIVMVQHLREEYEAVAAVAKAENILFYEAEQKVLGLTHVDIANWMMEKWKLPPETAVPIKSHHAFSASAPHAERTAIIHVSDLLVRALGVGNGLDEKVPVANEEAFKMIGITIANLQSVVSELALELQEIA